MTSPHRAVFGETVNDETLKPIRFPPLLMGLLQQENGLLEQ